MHKHTQTAAPEWCSVLMWRRRRNEKGPLNSGGVCSTIQPLPAAQLSWVTFIVIHLSFLITLHLLLTFPSTPPPPASLSSPPPIPLILRLAVKLQAKLNLACFQNNTELGAASRSWCVFLCYFRSLEMRTSVPHEAACKVSAGTNETCQFFKDRNEHVWIRVIKWQRAKNTVLQKILQICSRRPLEKLVSVATQYIFY